MKKSKYALVAGIVLAAGSANADLMNISATAMHTASSLQGIACTIAGTSGPLYRGSKILFVFAESAGNGRDTKMRVSSLKYDLTLTNEDWRKPYMLNGVAYNHDSEGLFSSFLRTPYKSTDAAVIYFADPGEAVCVYSNEQTSDTAQYQVQISITDRTDVITAAGLKSAPAGAADPAAAMWSNIDLQKKLNPHPAQ